MVVKPMYSKPIPDTWSGRSDSKTDLASFRIHQVVQLSEINQVTNSQDKQTISLIGFACDEGVRRNQGRVGAAHAPQAIKSALAKLPWHSGDEVNIIDVGNIQCPDEDLEAAQAKLGEAVDKLLKASTTPIIIGGGHETLYGHYLGVRKAIGEHASLGIINIDAHFDLRPYDEQTSSGTMFRQILDQDKHSHYLCVGIQQHGNTAFLFNEADKYGCQYIYESDLTNDKLPTALNEIQTFMNKHDVIMLTLCSDVICASAAPGVSAPAPFGLEPRTVRTLVETIISNKKTISFDISEVNPLLDENERTVRLASYLLADVIMHFTKKDSN